jgi:hypothetical protein
MAELMHILYQHVFIKFGFRNYHHHHHHHLPRGLRHLICSGIEALPSFPVASTTSSASRLVVEAVVRESGVVHSFKMVDTILFVFGAQVLVL